ncbi:MAG: dipeptide epimerase [Anaerolineales bacterium]|nr:dipeptide epimerase [Anaerolineales bacterium]
MPTITKIEIIELDIPYPHPFKIALAVMNSARNIVIRVHDSDGLVGVGEGCPPRFVTGEAPETAFEAAKLYAQILIGKNPMEIDTRLRELEQYMLKNPAIRCAYDLALYDLLAKHAELPLYALLGGEKKVIYSNRTIGIDSPDKMAAIAKQHVENGTKAIKVKVGTGKAEDIERIRAIREAIGNGVPLRLDANQAWDEITTINILTALAEYEIEVCEQPLPYWNIEGLKRVRERSPIAIMADESIFDAHDAFRLASHGAVDYFNIKLAKSAGIHGAMKINAIGEVAGIKCMLGGMSESLIGVGAGAHLICACPNISLHDLDSPFHFTEEPSIGGVDFQPNGTVTLSDDHGHGADVSPEWMERSKKIVISEK